MNTTDKNSLSAIERAAILKRMQQERYDCIVIGGGITGAGVAREAVRRGLSVALVEQDDFSAGTSSRSSKLIHGGLRYLAMGDFALVRETARERKSVNAMAPHLAEPRFMVVPVGSRLNLAFFQAGIAMYERLGQVAKQDRQQHWSEERLHEELPLLRRDRYPHACAYREYLTDDSRLVLANVRDAARHGAAAVNYVEVTGLIEERRRVTGVRCRCRISGEEFAIRGRGVVNAAGPWAEALWRQDPLHGPKEHHLHLSKGIHIALPREKFPVQHLMFLTVGDGRNIFTFPRGDVVYIGTTDTTYSSPPRIWPEIERKDVEYLLAPLDRYFDIPRVTPEDCISAWAGLRPLVAQPGKPTKEISRREEIWVGDSGLVTIVGGKLTGYRLMAVEAVDEVCRQIGSEAPAVKGLPALPGGDFEGSLADLSARLERATDLEGATCDRLVRLYGNDAFEVVELGQGSVAEGSRVITGEIEWGVTRELAITLTDMLYRRTRAAFYEVERAALVKPIAREMAALLGWGEPETARQVAATMELLRDDLAFQNEN